MAILFEIQIFNKAMQYRGMSLYMILVFVLIDVMLIVFGYGYLDRGDLIGPLVSLFMGVWKIRRMVTIHIVGQFPFVAYTLLHFLYSWVGL